MQLSFSTGPGGEVAECFLPGPPEAALVPADRDGVAELLILRSWPDVLAALRNDTLRNLREIPCSHAVAGVTLQHDAGLLRRDAVVNVRPLLNRIWERGAAEKLRPELNQLAWVSAGLARRNRTADLVESFVRPYVHAVSMLAAGCTMEEASALATFSDLTTGALLQVPDDHIFVRQAWDSLYALAGGMVGNSRLFGNRGLLGQSVAVLDHAGLSDEEVRDTVTTIYNGLPTLRPVLTRALQEVLARPAVLDACHAYPGLVPVVVTEALRYAAHFTFGLPGLATEETELETVTVLPGTVVLPVIHAAHLDAPGVLQPGVFDASRQRRGNLAWGAGQHACLGRHLGTVALEEAVAVISACHPTLRRAPEVLEYEPGTMPVPLGLPVQW